MLLPGCVYDKYASEVCIQEEEPLYLSFLLGSRESVADTKAEVGGYNKKAVAEQLVSRVDIYFYDLDGNYLDHKWVPNSSEEGMGSFNQPGMTADGDDEGGNVANRVGDFYVKLTKYRPARMILAMNLPEATATGFENQPLSYLRAAKQEKSTAWAGSSVTVKYPDSGSGTESETVNPFFMTSSTYLNAGGSEVCDILIPSSYLLETSTKALARPIPVYVERMAAKVMVRPGENAGTPVTEFRVPAVTRYPGITAKVTILGWALNGLNRSAYYYKKVDKSWNFNWTGVSWNEPSRYRSHWSEDPNYTTGSYPLNYNNYKTSSLDWADRELEYVKFEDIGDGNFTTNSVENAQYCLENTADGALLAKDLALNELYPRTTHVLVKSRIYFDYGKGMDGSLDTDDYKSADDIFRYKGVFYTKKGLVKVMLGEFAQANSLQDKFYTNNTDPLVEVTEADFDVEHLYGEHVYLKPNLAALYDKDKNPVDRGVLTTFLEANKADGFKDRYFYYKVPVEHLTAGNNESNYPTAQYGVVRNHNYTITLGTQVNGVGTGVWDLEEPIVPVAMSGYDLSVFVGISPWKEFETRFVFLDPAGMLVTNGQEVKLWQDGDDPNATNDWSSNGWYF